MSIKVPARFLLIRNDKNGERGSRLSGLVVVRYEEKSGLTIPLIRKSP
jgi:hypothetical protein